MTIDLGKRKIKEYIILSGRHEFDPDKDVENILRRNPVIKLVKSTEENSEDVEDEESEEEIDEDEEALNQFSIEVDEEEQSKHRKILLASLEELVKDKLLYKVELQPEVKTVKGTVKKKAVYSYVLMKTFDEEVIKIDLPISIVIRANNLINKSIDDLGGNGEVINILEFDEFLFEMLLSILEESMNERLEIKEDGAEF